MACFNPLRAWRGTRDRQIYWRNINDSTEIALACGQCKGCRLERSRQWATRCLHESKMHKRNSFLTLTYNDESLPSRFDTGLRAKDGSVVYGGTLHHRHIQLFFKKLRERIQRQSGETSVLTPPGLNTKALGRKPAALLYYMCGEYGEKNCRPHYHVCLFGHDYDDKKYHTTSETGFPVYVSKLLDQIWGLGHSYISELNWQTAAYAARYVMKKVNGDQQEKHYTKICAETGEIIRLTPEYNRMSLSTGIGKNWLNKFFPDVYPHGYVVLPGGVKTTPPRYYDKIFKQRERSAYEEMKDNKGAEAAKKWQDQTPERLAVREEVATAQIKLLRRKI